MKASQDPKRARTYRLGRRQVTVDRTRAQLLIAARRILMTKGGLAAFSLESVARRAGVTRLTVYHQFGSKVGLLEAIYDDLGRSGRIAEQLAASFQLPDPVASLNAIVAAFAGFWSTGQLVIRRLRSMAVLDPSFKGATDRDSRRHGAMRAALLRLAAARKRSVAEPDRCASVLAMLTSFETFDSLAQSGSTHGQIVCTVQELVQTVAESSLR